MQQLKRGVPVEDAAGAGETPSELLGLRAFRIPRGLRDDRFGRTSVYAAIKSGELIARKWNRCTIVLAEDVAAFLTKLPKVNDR